MEQLARYEQTLAAERQANDALESRLLALRAQADDSIARFDPRQQPAKQPATAPAPPKPAAPPVPDATVFLQQLQAIQAALENNEQQFAGHSSRQDASSVMSATRGRQGVPSSAKSVLSVGRQSAGGRSTSQSSVRRGTGGRGSVLPDTATSSVVYRSAMYRSVSPSKRATNGVVVSNFGRSTRFKDDKVDVPGPGQYDPHSTDFAPVAVTAGKIDDGNLGHTWSLYNATVGTGYTQTQEHYNKMAAATARLRSPEPGARHLDALSPGTVGSSVSQARPGGAASTVLTQHGDSVEAAVAAMVSAHHGNATAALTSNIRKERALRKELSIIRGNSNTVRMQAGQQASVYLNEMDALKARGERKDKAIAGGQAKLRAWTDVFLRADQTMAELVQWMNDAQAASGRNPALNRAADTVRTLQTIIESAQGLVEAGGSGRVQSDEQSVAGSTQPAGGFMAYSSLSAALTNPSAGAVGDLGASHSLVAGQVAKQRAVAAAPPPPAPRDRSLTGAQQAGLGLDATLARNVSAADIQSGAAARMPLGPSRSISLSDVKSFTQAAVDGLRTASGTGGAAPARPAHDPYEPQIQAALARMNLPTAQARGGSPPPRRGAGGFLEPSDAPSGSGADASVQSRLHLLYAYYSGVHPSSARGGALSSGGSGMRQQDFLQLLGDAGALGRASEYLADAQGAFSRAAASAAGRPSAAQSSGGECLAFDAWVVAVTDFSCRRHGVYPPGADPSGLLVSPEAFRTTLDSFLQPLTVKLRAADPAFQTALATAQGAPGGGSSSSSSGAGAAQQAAPAASQDEYSALRASLAGFAEAFLRPDVLSFFNDHKGALQGLFSHYATQGGTGALADKLNRRGLLAFASDARISPDMIGKGELLMLAREVAHVSTGKRRSAGPSSPEKDVVVSYPEWCELLGLIAHVVVGPAHAKTLLAGAVPTMLQKLQLLVLDMSHRGATWPAAVGEVQKMIRGVEESIRAAGAQAAAGADEAASRAATRAAMQQRFAGAGGQPFM